GRKVSDADFADERARRLVEREFNLSFTDAPPAHNSVTAGKWFAPGAREVSVEEGIARTLGWSLGDELTFTVGSESFSARVTSLRKLRWDSMKVNFFVIAPPKVLEGFPASYISAFRLPAGNEKLMLELTAKYPNLTVVDVGAAGRRAAGAVLGAGRDGGRTPPRSGGDARARRVAQASHRQPARRVPRDGAACRPSSDGRSRGDRPAPRAPRVRARPATQPGALDRRPACRRRAA